MPSPTYVEKLLDNYNFNYSMILQLKKPRLGVTDFADIGFVGKKECQVLSNQNTLKNL